MRVIVTLFWGFIFSFVAIFIISSILGSNGQSYSIKNCAILSVIFAVCAVLFDLTAFDKNRKIEK